jgi:hypothetical protein
MFFAEAPVPWYSETDYHNFILTAAEWCALDNLRPDLHFVEFKRLGSRNFCTNVRRT